MKAVIEFDLSNKKDRLEYEMYNNANDLMKFIFHTLLELGSKDSGNEEWFDKILGTFKQWDLHDLFLKWNKENGFSGDLKEDFRNREIN